MKGLHVGGGLEDAELRGSPLQKGKNIGLAKKSIMFFLYDGSSSV